MEARIYLSRNLYLSKKTIFIRASYGGRNELMNKKLVIYIILLIVVPLGGEFQLYPGVADIRISLGTPIFFFFLLWSKNIKPIPAGILVGISVVLFRTILSIQNVYCTPCFSAFSDHAPVFFYYVVYGLLFYLFKTRSFYDRPIVIVLIGMLIEVIASLTEIFFRNFYISDSFTLKALITIFIISFFRSFFVLGVINFFLLHEANVTRSMQEKQNNQMLILVSDLFVEMVQLKKSMKNAETTTRECYELYQSLMTDGCHTYAKKALKIAGEVHEIKKDHHRIYAGLKKLKVNEQATNLMKIDNIVEVAVKCNESYAKVLKKNIHFHVTILGEHPYYNNFLVLSLINNLITNSIEAIEEEGDISIIIDKCEENIKIAISDNGPGIPLDKQSVVFEPGYTTKYDSAGFASNGIGLSHIKEVIENLHGDIQLYSSQEHRETTFIIHLPIKNINYSG